MADEIRVRHQWLRGMCNDIQVGFGMPEGDSDIVSDCLVEADLMGIDTHGVIRLKLYVDRIREGGNNPNPNMRRVKDSPSTALLDADNALGPVGGKMGMDFAIEKAEEHGIAMVLVRNCNHYGPAGCYSRMALLTGMLAGSRLDHDMHHAYKSLDKPGWNSFTMAAVRVDRFTELAEFKGRMDEWIRMMRNTRKAPGVDRIWLPGEKEAATRAERTAQGIPLNEKMIEELAALAKEAGVPFDMAER